MQRKPLEPDPTTGQGVYRDQTIDYNVLTGIAVIAAARYFARARAPRKYLLDPRVDLLDPRYRPNDVTQPERYGHAARARRKHVIFSNVVSFLDLFTNKHLMPIFFTLYYADVTSCLK